MSLSSFPSSRMRPHTTSRTSSPSPSTLSPPSLPRSPFLLSLVSLLSVSPLFLAVLPGTAQASQYGLIDFSIFEKDYCSKPDGGGQQPAMIDTNQIDCTKLMEFLYLARESTRKQILIEKSLFEADKATTVLTTTAAEDEGTIVAQHRPDMISAKGYPLVMYVSRIAMFVTAHAHIIGAIISQRDECFYVVRMCYVQRRSAELVGTGCTRLGRGECVNELGRGGMSSFLRFRRQVGGRAD